MHGDAKIESIYREKKAQRQRFFRFGIAMIKMPLKQLCIQNDFRLSLRIVMWFYVSSYVYSNFGDVNFLRSVLFVHRIVALNRIFFISTDVQAFVSLRVILCLEYIDRMNVISKLKQIQKADISLSGKCFPQMRVQRWNEL